MRARATRGRDDAAGHGPPGASRRPRRSLVLGLTLTLALVASACAPILAPGSDGPGGTFAHPTFAGSGPYQVGVTTVAVGDDREAEIWYPSTRRAVRNVPPDTYFIRDFLSPLAKSLIPETINPPFETDAHREVRAAPGRFPIVLFSHGALSYRLQSTFLTTHLASWGFVVASPDFLERGLQTFLGTPPETPKSNVQVLTETLAAVEAEHTRPGGLLRGRLRTDVVMPIGHSAGASASAQFAEQPGIDAWVALGGGAAAPTAEGRRGLWIAGENDQIASLGGIQARYTEAPPPKRLVVVSGSGHNNAFSDICEIGTEGGGLIALAREAGLPVPDELARLGEDGCLEPNLPSPEVWPVTRHFVTAHLRFEAGLARLPWGLGPSVADRFDVDVTYDQDVG